MIEVLKKQLLENLDKIIELLEHYGYCKIKNHSKYISFARDEQGSSKSISLYLDDNLIVKDWVTSDTYDIFNFIIRQKGISFKEIISYTRNLLGANDELYRFSENKAVFGGFYESIKNKSNIVQKALREEILDEFKRYGNTMFLEDNIDLKTQLKFNISYSIENQCITIPIRDEIGQLIGIKARWNKRHPDENELRYYYLYPCSMSQILYGYSENYEYLEGANVVYLFESEKSVLASYSMGYRNALAIGSASLSQKQCQLILSLHPKKVVFMHDVGLNKNVIKANMIKLKSYARMRELEIGYWNNENKGYPDKVSATDLGKEEFERILKEEISYERP